MKKIILDTNFLLIPLEFGVDIFSEFDRLCDFNYRLFIFDKSISELKNIIEKQSGKSKRAAQFALKLIKLKDLKILKTKHSHVDEAILNNLDKEAVFATQDMRLKAELRKKGASIIILRQKKYLQLIEGKLYK